MGIDLDLATLCPELPAARADGIRLQRHLEVAIAAHGAQQGVGTFLGGAAHLDDLLDRRALVVLLAHLSNLDVLPQLPLPAAWPGRHPDLRRRLLRPLEFATLRAAAFDARRTTLLRLIAGGASEPEIASLPTAQVDLGPNGEVWASVAGGRGRIARRVALAPGAAPAVEELLTDSRDGYLIPLATPDDSARRCAAIDMILRRLLQTTGLASDPTVTVASIRNTGLRAVYDHFGLEAAAAMAGTTNPEILRGELGLVAHRPRRHQTGRCPAA